MASNSLLEIIKQPNKKFFKDEGGKKNNMLVQIKYNGYKKLNIPLVASLYFDNGMYAMEQQDILKMKDNNKFLFDTSKENIKNIYFRIEKVSRRLDNKKLRVRFEVDKTHEKFNNSFKDINSINTNSIEVLSKRKIPAHLRDNPNEIEKHKNKKRKRKIENKFNFYLKEKLKEELKEELKEKIKEELKEELNNNLKKELHSYNKIILTDFKTRLEETNKLLLKQISNLKNTLEETDKNNEQIIVNVNRFHENFIDTNFIDKTKSQYKFTPCGYFPNDNILPQYDDLYNTFVNVNDINPLFFNL